MKRTELREKLLKCRHDEIVNGVDLYTDQAVTVTENPAGPDVDLDDLDEYLECAISRATLLWEKLRGMQAEVRAEKADWKQKGRCEYGDGCETD